MEKKKERSNMLKMFKSVYEYLSTPEALMIPPSVNLFPGFYGNLLSLKSLKVTLNTLQNKLFI